MTNSNARSEIRPFLCQFEIEIVQQLPSHSLIDEIGGDASRVNATLLGSTKLTRVRDETTDDE